MIEAYCVDPLTIWKWNGVDDWNEPVSGFDYEVKGYIEWKTRLVKNIKGEDVASSVTIKLSKKIDIELGRALSHNDMIQLDGEDFQRAILNIGQPKAFSDPHYEVALS